MVNPLILLAAVATPASSSDMVALSNVKAGMLAEMCRAETSAVQLDPCNSFIMGAADGLQIGRSICITDVAGYSYVVVGVVRKYLADNPQEWGKPATVVIWDALRRKFRCP